VPPPPGTVPAAPTQTEPPPPGAKPQGVPLIDVLRETAAQLSRPGQVRWATPTPVQIPAFQAPRLAHAAAELVDAASGKGAETAVLVSAETQGGRLALTIRDAAPGAARGEVALGPRPQVVLALVRRMGATLTASPGRSGQGTDTVLSLPL
jgi:hypothetical protein